MCEKERREREKEEAGGSRATHRVDGHKTFICSDNTLNKHGPSVNLLARYLAVA